MAAEAAGKAQKALTGDVYVRKWQSVKKRPKSKGGPLLVDHEVHVNPVMVILGLGAAATAGIVALWMGQRKLSYGVPEGGAKLHYIMKQYDAKSHLETVVDEPGYTVPATGHYEATGTGVIIGHGLGYTEGAMKWVEDSPAYDVPAVTHEQRVYDKPARIVVYTLKGMPIRTYEGVDTTKVLTERQKALGWVYDSTEEWWAGEDSLGVFTAMRMTFKNEKKKKLGTGERTGFLG